MKVFTQHYPRELFEEKLGHLSHIIFSFFLDILPQSQEQLSPVNIFAHQEPNEYTGAHDWVIQNQHLFSLIMTWSDKILHNCKHAVFQAFGSSWLKPEQYAMPFEKKFVVSHVRGNYLKTYGHSLRYEYHDRAQKELRIPHKSWVTAGIREQIETCAVAKLELFGDAHFGVVIENTCHRGYFTEKIMEMFLLRTIPVYWGCSNIGDFFDAEGIIQFRSVDDAIHALNSLDENYYSSRIKAVEHNFQTALKYVNYWDNLVEHLTKIFRINGLY